MPHALIFDCDGVLVDSEKTSCQAALDVLLAKGIATDLAEVWTMTGKTNLDMIEYYNHKYHTQLDIRTLNPEIENHYMELAKELKPMPGIKTLLEKLLNRGIPIAVASSGNYEKIEFSLTTTGLKRYFSVICSGVDVPKGKPEPDLFLYTAKKLGQAPAACIVVEDSLNGIIGAKRAGMTTIAYTSSFSRAELIEVGADYVIDDYQEFLPLLGQLHIIK